MIQIKKTKSVEMNGDVKNIGIWISTEEYNRIVIPARLVFQVKRGLESYVQRFYRKHEKHTLEAKIRAKKIWIKENEKILR